MTSAMQLLCSTGALSHFPDSTGYQAMLEYGPQLEVDGFELMFYPRTIPGRQTGPIENVLRAIEHDPRSQVALDTEFLANFQQLESIFTTERLWREQRIHHVHVKDTDGHLFFPNGKRNYLHPGEGNIDFATFF